MATRTGAAAIPSSPSYNDNEAASQQILAEANSPVRRPTAAPTAAERGAILLNAARTLPKPSAPAGRVGTLPRPVQLKSSKLPKLPKPGKLPRASLSNLISEGSQKKARGRQLYDIEPSPQKKRRSLPAQIAALEDEEDSVVPETSQLQPDDEGPAEIPEGLDVSAPAEDRLGDDDIVDAPTSPAAVPEREASPAPKKRPGRPRKSGGSVASRKSVASAAGVQEEVQQQADLAIVDAQSKRKTRPERDLDTDFNGEKGARPAKKVRKLQGPKMISPDTPGFEEDSHAQAALPRPIVRLGALKDAWEESREARRQNKRQDVQPRRDAQPEVRIPIRPSLSRTAQAQGEPANAPEQPAAGAIERKGKAAPRIARETRAAMTFSATDTAQHKKPSRKGKMAASNLIQSAESNGRHGEKETLAPTGPEVSSSHVDAGDDDAVNEQTNADRVENDHDTDDGECDEQDNNAAADSTGDPDLDKVFKFSDRKEHAGVCAVGLAKKIHRNCDRVCISLSADACSLDDINASKDKLVLLLSSIRSNIRRDTRVDFKYDAFAYLFRALASVFQAMYNKLRQWDDEALESYKAMRIQHSFARELLRFKDTMDSWKVKVQQRNQGDRLIKSVETSLISPLRIVEKKYKKQLVALERAEQYRQVQMEIQQQQEKQEQELIAKEEALRSVRERRKRWQDLHIARMQYESDPHRRRRLRFVEPLDTAETDANGNRFERVPFFGERSAPPPSSSVATSGREWTQEQETVLLDALQSSASLERIFMKHCRPGGTLRDFSVTDFAAKLAWIRSAWAQLSHQHGWELPEWVKQIPVLP